MRNRPGNGIVAGMEHGTTIAYRRHLRAGETACQPCKDAAAAAERERRRARGIGPPPKLNCGTHSGYVGHVKRGQKPCDACREGHAQYQLEYRRRTSRAARRGTWNDVILDYLETWGGMAPVNLASRIAERHPDVKHRTVLKALLRMEERGLVEADRYGPNDVVYRVSDWYLENVG